MTDFLGSDDIVDDYKIPEIFLSEDTVSEQEAIMSILAPFTHTYFYVAKSLKLLFNTSILETEFVKIVINDIKKKVDGGYCLYGKNCIKSCIFKCIYIFIILKVKVFLLNQ